LSTGPNRLAQPILPQVLRRGLNIFSQLYRALNSPGRKARPQAKAVERDGMLLNAYFTCSAPNSVQTTLDSDPIVASLYYFILL
jgi:hypothetical protein